MTSKTRVATRATGLLAAAGLVLAACASSSTTGATPAATATTAVGAGGSDQYGQLPSGLGTKLPGGTATIALVPGAPPSYIFPITPAADSSVYTAYQFQDLMWRPLWWGPEGDLPTIDYSQSMAGPPVFSNHNKTVTIALKPDWKWSDGTPITSKDVAFFIDLLEAAVKLSPANYDNYTPGLFPDFLTSVRTPNASTVVLTIDKTYNENFLFLDELDFISPLPAQAWSKASADGPLLDFTKPANAARIYKFLAAQSGVLRTYATNPLWQTVDGPYRLASFDPSTGGDTMVANENYTGPVKPTIKTLDFEAFTSTTAEFEQLLSGNLDVGGVDFSDLAQVPKLRAEGYRVWGYPDFGFSYIAYNFKDRTGDFDNVIKQLYIRQALAHLQDEEAVIRSKGLFDGAAVEAYGPVPTVPKSPFAPAKALSNPYPYSISAAKSLLISHGWTVVPNGLSTCARPGTGATDCGAGVPKGTGLSWNLVYSNWPDVIGQQDEMLASTAKRIGIEISLSAKTFNSIISSYSDVGNPDNDNKWAMEDFGGFTDSYYPTTNELLNTTGSFNEGGYSDPIADRDITNSVSSLSNSAVETEISYITEQQPGLFQPNQDLVTAFKGDLQGPPASFADTSQYFLSPEYWYFVKS